MGWLQLGLRASVNEASTGQYADTGPALGNKGGVQAVHVEHADLDVLPESQPDSLGTPKALHSSSSAPASHEAPKRKYPFQPISLPHASLPFISTDEVASKRRPGLTVHRDDVLDTTDLWIVIDDIVYDCSGFIDDHPGGRQVIASFLGEDCSWQFWRFHSRAILKESGLPLRIGRTKDVQNRFKEAPRYVGLRRLGQDDY